MKIIFLDIDGPLVNRRSMFIERIDDNYEQFDPLAVQMINDVVRKTNAKIVISSSWRESDLSLFPNKTVGIHLRKHCIELNGMIDAFHTDWNTPIISCFSDTVGYFETRPQEVQVWLNSHPETTKFCIVDDLDIFYPEQEPNFVKVDGQNGLMFEDYKKMLAILA